MNIDGIKPKKTLTDLQSNTGATPIRVASYFTDELKKSIFDDTTTLKSLRLKEDQSSKNNKEIGNNKDTEDNIGNNKDTEDNKEIERLEAKIKLEAKPFIGTITLCIKKINELEKYITNKNPNEEADEEANEELISSLKKLVVNRVQEFTSENLLSLALSISYKRDKELKTVLYKVWKIYIELNPTPAKVGQDKANKYEVVNQDQVVTTPAVMPNLFSGGRVETRPNTPRPTQPSIPTSLDVAFSLQSNKINKNDLELIMPAGISNTDADKYVALINGMMMLIDRLYDVQTMVLLVKKLAIGIGLDKLRSSFDKATVIYQRNPKLSKLYLICTALDKASRMIGYKDPAITTVTQGRAVNAAITTSPMPLESRNMIIQPFPNLYSIPVDKIIAWRPLAKIETMTRAAALSQKKKRIFNNGKWRKTLLALVASVALFGGNSLFKNSQNVVDRLIDDEIITGEGNIQYTRGSLQEEINKKKKELKEEFDKSLTKKIVLPTSPKPDKDYKISFKNKKELSVPSGSNVWRVVEVDLKEQISNFKDLSKADRDTLIANIIKAMSSIYKSNNSKNPNNNLSMVQAGEYLQIPTIKIKNQD